MKTEITHTIVDDEIKRDAYEIEIQPGVKFGMEELASGKQEGGASLREILAAGLRPSSIQQMMTLAAVAGFPGVQALAEERFESEVRRMRAIGSELTAPVASRALMRGTGPNPIVCPACGQEHQRDVWQGGAIPTGAVLGCPCGAIMRVTETGFGFELDTKTCTVEELKMIDRTRQEMKRAKRRWEQQQANNREAARARDPFQQPVKTRVRARR